MLCESHSLATPVNNERLKIEFLNEDRVSWEIGKRYFVRMMSPLHPVRWRKIFIGFLLVLATILGLAIVIVPSPDLSVELELRKQIAVLNARIQHAELLNVERKSDLQRIFSQFSDVTKLLQADSHRGSEREILDEITALKGGGRSDVETEALIKHLNWTFDLSLPTIHHYLPHTVHSPNSFIPAFKLSKNKSQVRIVLGIPTVKRDHQSYLESTLQSVFENMSEDEMSDCLVIVFVAELDLDYVSKIGAQVQSMFGKHIERGVLEVISPPADFYPNLTALRPTLGDEPERVQWRSKQNLDYAFLMMYAQWRGIYYVQLEDDILTKPNFVTTMLDFAAEKTALSESSSKSDWFVIDFCQLGFIGKMFKGTSLPILIQFFLMFYNDKPVDWLLDHVITTKICKLDQDAKKCQKERAALWIHYKPSLFQHIGTHSSLKGKVQKLKDKQFGKVALFTPHKNPSGKAETNIKHYKHHSIARAYRGETFYWGLVPQSGDYIIFQLTPPVQLSSVRFVSGNVEHPSDRFVGTTVELMFKDADLKSPEFANFEKLSDNFVVVGTFDANGVAETKLNTDKKVSIVRLSIHESSENWAILSEIHLRPASPPTS